MTHQTVLDEDSNFPLAPDSPFLFDNNTDPRGHPAVLPPTSKSKQWKTSKNLLASFTGSTRRKASSTFRLKTPQTSHSSTAHQFGNTSHRTHNIMGLCCLLLVMAKAVVADCLTQVLLAPKDLPLRVMTVSRCTGVACNKRTCT